MIGSFLNVIIHRLPKISEIQYRLICANYIETFFKHKKIKGSLNQKRYLRKIKTHLGVPYNGDAFSLSTPKIPLPKLLKNLELDREYSNFSFLILKGRCKTCKNPIGENISTCRVYFCCRSPIYFNTALPSGY